MTMHSTLAGEQLHEAFHYVASADPGAVGAGLYWLDTSADPYVLKRRNAGDTDWITVGAAGGGGSGDVTYAVLQASMLVNELMNFPSRELADDVQPDWWDEADANATLTEVDIAGESLASIPPTGHKRAHKVVVAAANSNARQRFTYADQPRLGVGVKVSALYLIYSVGAAAARIRLQSSVGSLGASSDVTAAAWTLAKIENVTLDGTFVDIREEVDVGTAYFIPLAVHIGAKALPLKPRSTRKVVREPVSVLDLTGAADPAAWTDVDLTANTSALAVHAYMRGYLWETTATTEYRLYVRKNGSAGGNNDSTLVIAKYSSGDPIENSVFEVALDAAQIFEYFLDRFAGTSDLNGSQLYVYGYDEWE